jgi:hypothetical protein
LGHLVIVGLLFACSFQDLKIRFSSPVCRNWDAQKKLKKNFKVIVSHSAEKISVLQHLLPRPDAEGFVHGQRQSFHPDPSSSHLGPLQHSSLVKVVSQVSHGEPHFGTVKEHI